MKRYRQSHKRVIATCTHPGCRQQLETAANHVKNCLCPKHRAEHERASRDLQNAKEREKNALKNPDGRAEMQITIVRDPDIECGFRSGAQMSTRDLEYMLKFGSFTVGTVFRKRTKAYMVVGLGAPQKMVEVAA
jgi:hypothetical protein